MKRICATIVGVSVLAGCAAQPTPQEWEKRAMPFVQDGAATREQLLLKLGEPTAHFENDRILTWFDPTLALP